MWTQRAISKPILKKLESLVASRQYIYDPDKHRLVPQFQNIIDFPWIFFGCSVNVRNCHLWTNIMFKQFDLVPSFCRFRCHKIVAYPQTVLDTIRLYHFANALPFFTNSLTIPCGKVGMDRRSYTSSPWSAFWYANSLPHAKKIYSMIHSTLIKVGMSSLADTLIIKKACTEMEAAKGPTDGPFWQSISPDDQLLEDRLNDIFLVEPDDATPQPNWHINGIIEAWLDHARTHGDRSGDNFFGVETLPKPKTYHNPIPIESNESNEEKEKEKEQ